MSRDPYHNSTGALERAPDDRWERESYTRVRDEHFAHGALPTRRRSPVGRGPPSTASSRPYPDGEEDMMDRRYYPRDREEIPPNMAYEREPRYAPTKTRHLSPSPPPTGRVPRPGVLRRQSSLDTYDRLPTRFYQREEYGPPARREDYQPASYASPQPVPRSYRLGPPPEMAPPRREYYDDPPSARRPTFDEPLYRGGIDPYAPPASMSGPPSRRPFHDDIHVAEPGYYGDEDFHPVHEREFVHEHRRSRRRGRGRSRSKSRDRSRTRSRSRDSRTTTTKSYTATSRSSSTSSKSSRSSRTTVKNQYPKKGKTRIPARLVSKRALLDIGYPFEDDGTTVVVLLALGQDNIDDLLKLSEDYKKAEQEVEAGYVVEETKALPAPLTTTVVVNPPPAPAPVVVSAPNPRSDRVEIIPPIGPPVEIMESKKYTREVSPARTYTTDLSYTTGTTDAIDRHFESEHMHLGPMVLAKDHHRRRHKSKSRSRSRSARHGERAIDAQIRELEAEKHALRHSRRHGRSRHRSSSLDGGEVVRYHERLSNGDLVVYEERTEEFSDSDSMHHHSHSRSRHSRSHHRSKSRGPRIEKDRKGRLSLKIPTRR